VLSAPEPIPSVLERTHSLLEGPCVVPEGIAYSDVLAGGVFLVRDDGRVEELLARRRGIGGIVAHRDGGVVISGRTITHLRRGAAREVHVDESATGFNDIAVDPDGAVVAGVLRYNLLRGEDPVPGELCRIAAEGAITTLATGITWPNGIGFSPDGETMYASDYAAGEVLAIRRGSQSGEVFAKPPRGAPDGLAVDREGGVWVALGDAGAIARFSPDGSVDSVTDVPAGFVSSLCFGGEDLCDVYITTGDNLVSPQTGGTLFHARADVPGLPLAMAAV
jgi:sugar lactone lactonase YvrE